MLTGILVALAAAACYETAYVQQAREARGQSRTLALRLSLLIQLMRNPRWAAATAATVAGAALQLWALTLAPVSVVAPTLAVGLLALPWLARRVLHERLGTRDLLAVLAIVSGVIVVAAAGPTHVGRQEAGLELALELVVLIAVLLAPFALRTHGAPARLAVFAAATGDAAAAIGLKLAADELHRGRLGFAVLWGALGASCGAFAITAEMTALQSFQATQVAPVVVAFQVLVPVATGLAFLGDSWSGTPGGGLLLAAAVGLVVAGGATLGASRSVDDILAEEAQDERGGGRQPREA